MSSIWQPKEISAVGKDQVNRHAGDNHDLFG